MDRSRGPRRGRRIALALSVALGCAALAVAVAGIVLGLRTATPGEYDTALGSVSLHVAPSTHGEIDAYVPLADWMRASPPSRRR